MLTIDCSQDKSVLVDLKINSQEQIMVHFACKIGILRGPKSLSCPEMFKIEESNQPFCDQSVLVSNDLVEKNFTEERKIPFMKSSSGQNRAIIANIILLSPMIILLLSIL